jgi:2-oxoisovalerate dehydrogenase E1 component
MVMVCLLPLQNNLIVKNLSDRAHGYGMESHIIDGNNILEVYTKLKAIAADVRENPRPIMLEFKTFRVRGHEEASGTKYVPNELLQSWDLKDPLLNFAAFLKTQGVLTEEIEAASKASIVKEIQDGLDIAFAEPAYSIDYNK